MRPATAKSQIKKCGTSPFFKTAVLTLFSLGLTLGMSECVLHLINYPSSSWSPWEEDPHTGFHFAPRLNQQMITEEYDVSIQTNDQGFRDDPMVQPKQEKRILFLGDSFTFGYGVERPFIFADLLEKKMNLEILNTAAGGFDLIHQVQFVKHYAQNYNPDLMVYFLYLGNDLVGNWKWKLENNNITASHRPTLRSHRDIKLWTILKMLRHRLQFKLPSNKIWQTPQEYLALSARALSPEAVRDYETSKALIQELAQSAARSQIKIAVVLIPYKTMVEEDAQNKLKASYENFDARYDLTYPRTKVSGWLEELQIPFLDLTPFLIEKAHDHSMPLYYQKDGHFTPEAHQLITEPLSSFLSAQLISNKTPS